MLFEYAYLQKSLLCKEFTLNKVLIPLIDTNTIKLVLVLIKEGRIQHKETRSLIRKRDY